VTCPEPELEAGGALEENPLDPEADPELPAE